MKVQFSNIPVSLDAMLPENGELLRREALKACGIKGDGAFDVRVVRRSIDARKKSNVHFVVTTIIDLPDFEEGDISRLKLAKGISAKVYEPQPPIEVPDLSEVGCRSGFERPVIVGAGPAGLFCALYLARAGLRPLVIERGKPVDERLKDVECFSSGGRLDPESNVQFGEGGAGTFSDGKLNTGTKSPHIRHVLEELVDAGAPSDILIDAKPHIGTDLLAEVVHNLRCAIEKAGGDFSFSTRLEEVVLDSVPRSSAPGDPESGNKNGYTSMERQYEVNAIKVCHVDNVAGDKQRFERGSIETIPVSTLVLAIGHSARDTFAMLESIGVEMRRKPFAIGLRIEHKQKDLDKSQYGRFAGHQALGAADYKLAMHTEDGRGVYTFCMCPGGEVVAAASEEGAVCVNGMSRHARAGENGNSAMLVEIKPEDLPGNDVLAGVEFQRSLERSAFDLGSRSGREPYTAPAQTVADFLENKEGARSSKVFPSYPRGVEWTNLREVLPAFMGDSLAEALSVFGERIEAFRDGQAVLTGIEARSSSPVIIVRDRGDMESVSVKGLYPCGEGAGYAGGIMSAAVDGIRVAEAICASM